MKKIALTISIIALITSCASKKASCEAYGSNNNNCNNIKKLTK